VRKIGIVTGIAVCCNVGGSGQPVAKFGLADDGAFAANLQLYSLLPWLSVD